jgi:hypothetical protein
LKEFYGIDDSFPHGQLMSRSMQEKKRFIYFASSMVKEVLANNDFDKLRVINAGVKVRYFALCSLDSAMTTLKIKVRGSNTGVRTHQR